MTAATASLPLQDVAASERLRKNASACRLSFTWWGTNRSLSKSQKHEAAQPFEANSAFLSAGKKIINTRHPAFQQLTAMKNRIAGYWKSMTLPYVEDGVRLIRKSDIAAFHTMMTDFQHELNEAARSLNDRRHELLEEARQQLGRLFNAKDYPDDLAELFAVEWDYPAIEPPGYLAQIAPEVYREEQERVAQKFQEAVHLAEEAFTQELTEMVEHLAERLQVGDDGKPLVFRDSAISNLVSFFDRFKQLNISSNRELEEAVTQAQSLVTGVKPAELRQDRNLREQIRSGMQQVADQLATLTIPKPRRKLLRPNRSTAACG